MSSRAVLTRATWAGIGAADGPARPTTDPDAVPTWADDAQVADAERDEVVLPMARLAALRRAADLELRGRLAALHPALAGDAAPDGGWVLGVAGGVAAGKSTIARLLAELLPAEVGGPVVVVSVDGYLRTNAELEADDLTARKGFPESYDHDGLRALLSAVRAGGPPVDAPVYAHRIQDRDPDRTVRVDRPAVLVLEGLGALSPEVRDLVDLGVYVDAAEDDARAWYLERFRAWRGAAADDPGALLHRIAEMPDEDADALALRVWETTNAPNVREHVLPTLEHADVVLEKGADHRVERVLVRTP
ncbi:type I pantothenate kinase [Patulibacter minatonensis]|uniref:type I pantothenate kinase n=1 Tax=Patulibacter minatonensis TaxID=298163 RepID=UPI000686117F|nr:type I pantothenate kinase [Patulibacter minatonensis]